MTTDQELDLLSEYMHLWIDYMVKGKLNLHRTISTYEGTRDLLIITEDELPFPTFEQYKTLKA